MNSILIYATYLWDTSTKLNIKKATLKFIGDDEYNVHVTRTYKSTKII